MMSRKVLIVAVCAVGVGTYACVTAIRNSVNMLHKVAQSVPKGSIDLSRIIDSAGLQGSGRLASKSYALDSFDSITAGPSIVLNCRIGSPQTVKVSADDNLLPYMEISVDDGSLKIESSRPFSTSHRIQVDVTVPSLKALTLSGASTGKVGGVSSSSFDLDLSGASHCDLDGQLGALDAEITGSSSATINGGTLTKLTLECSGASNLTATGSATSLDLDISGASGADLKGLQAKDAAIDVSGASWCDLKASGEVSGDASGASRVTAVGGPKMSVDSSGFSSVNAS